MNKQDQLLDVKELARILNLHPNTVYELRKNGRIPFGARFGSKLKWSRQGIRNWIAAGMPYNKTWEAIKAYYGAKRAGIEVWGSHIDCFDAIPWRYCCGELAVLFEQRNGSITVLKFHPIRGFNIAGACLLRPEEDFQNEQPLRAKIAAVLDLESSRNDRLENSGIYCTSCSMDGSVVEFRRVLQLTTYLSDDDDCVEIGRF